MPRQLALFLTVAFIIFLFWRDLRERPRVTGALWIPFVWMLLSASRFVSQWLDMGSAYSVASLEDGSPLDRLVFAALIGLGLCVLIKRHVKLSAFIQHNRWFVAYFIYCFIAISWSDFPYVAFKRWIKTIAEPLMVLVLATEPDPAEAVTRLLKRCAYVVIPLSIMLIKYFPEIGRTFSQWTGEGQNIGVTLSKNALGYDCMVLGIFFFCHFLKTWQLDKSGTRRNELIMTAGFLYMIVWLLLGAKSSTSLMSTVVGLLMVVALGLPVVSKRFIGSYFLVGMTMFLVADLGFGVFGGLIELLGKDSTLTGRTELWQEVLQIKINPFFGAGFESFWLGPRLEKMWALHWWKPTQAHNGYIETYLNLGFVGLFMLLGLVVATSRKIRLEMLRTFHYGRVRLAFLAAILVYNWTEAAFKTLHLVFFAFCLIAIDYPSLEFAGWKDSLRLAPRESRRRRSLLASSRNEVDPHSSSHQAAGPAKPPLRIRSMHGPRKRTRSIDYRDQV